MVQTVFRLQFADCPDEFFPHINSRRRLFPQKEDRQSVNVGFFRSGRVPPKPGSAPGSAFNGGYVRHFFVDEGVQLVEFSVLYGISFLQSELMEDPGDASTSCRECQ